MRALHRTIVGGAFGGLTAAAVAGSVAFACTPVDGLQVVDAEGSRITQVLVEPGDIVNLKITNFYDQGATARASDGRTVVAGPVEVSWFATTLAPSGTLIHHGTKKGFDLKVTIPAGVSPNPTDPSQIVVRQYDTAGHELVNSLASDSEAVFLRSSAPKGSPAPVSPPPSTRVELPTPTPAVLPVTPAVVTTAQAPVASAPRPAAAPTQVSPTAPAASAPAATPATAAVVAPETGRQQAPSDLWTGLSAERLPSLLDAGQAPARSSFPMGIVLFGAGLLTVAGAAVALGGRRLAVVRRITKR